MWAEGGQVEHKKDDGRKEKDDKTKQDKTKKKFIDKGIQKKRGGDKGIEVRHIHLEERTKEEGDRGIDRGRITHTRTEGESG